MKEALVYAYTQTGPGVPSYPGYVNLSQREGDRHPTLMVRTPGLNGMVSASCPVPDAQLAELYTAIGQYLVGKEAVVADDDERDSA